MEENNPIEQPLTPNENPQDVLCILWTNWRMVVITK